MNPYNIFVFYFRVFYLNCFFAIQPLEKVTKVPYDISWLTIRSNNYLSYFQVVTVNKDEHERILLETLNALFTTPPNDGHVNTDVLYDYGEDEPGPLQLSIPIGLDPQAAPLQGQEPYAQVSHSNSLFLNFYFLRNLLHNLNINNI